MRPAPNTVQVQSKTMKRTIIVMYLALLHVAVAGLAGAWGFGFIKRPNPSHTLTWVTQRADESDLKGAELGSIFPGWDKDTLIHYCFSHDKQVLEVTEFKDGIAIIGVTDQARGQTWLFTRMATVIGKPAAPVSLTRREVSMDGFGTGKRIDTYMDEDGDGIMEVRLGTTTDMNERVPRYQLRADAWEPWPWPGKSGTTLPGTDKP